MIEPHTATNATTPRRGGPRLPTLSWQYQAVSKVLEAFMTLDCSAVLALSAPDVAFEFPFIGDATYDAEGFASRVSRTIRLMTGLTFADLEVSPVGEAAVVARYSSSAHISKTDKPYTQRYLSLFEFDKGRFIYFQENFDTATFKEAFDLAPTWRIR